MCIAKFVNAEDDVLTFKQNCSECIGFKAVIRRNTMCISRITNAEDGVLTFKQNCSECVEFKATN